MKVKPVEENIDDLLNVIRFGSKLLSIAGNSVAERKPQLGDITMLLPRVPGLLKALPDVQRQWLLLKSGTTWQRVLDAFREEFDLDNDRLELFIERCADTALEVLTQVYRLVEAIKDYQDDTKVI